LAAVFGLVLVCVGAWAQSLAGQEVRYSVLYDLKTHATLPVVGYHLGDVKELFGKLNPEVWALAGLDANTQSGTLGTAVVLPLQAAQNLTVYFGGSLRIESAGTPHFGLVVGLDVKF